MSDKDSEILLDKVRELETPKSVDDSDKINTAKILGERSDFSPPMPDEEAKKQMRRRSRRTFLIGGAAAVLGYFGYSWLRQPEQKWLFERAFKFNEDVAQTFYSTSRLAPEFPKERISPPRVNGDFGLKSAFDPVTWRLQIIGLANQRQFPQYTDNVIYPEIEAQLRKPRPGSLEQPPPVVPIPGLLLTLDDIKALPKVEMTTELKCIEGWSVIVNWAGARFSDFMAAFPPQFKNYVSLSTPDGVYYVGMDMPSMLHPQTLLCYEMNGAPLKPEHGAPLRLVTTVKYGIKNIKRIGRIAFSDTRPADFWAEQDYDWYSGL